MKYGCGITLPTNIPRLFTMCSWWRHDIPGDGMTFFAIWGAVCVKQAHWIVGDRIDIFITHRVIITISEVSTVPIAVIFFVVVCLTWLYYHMLTVSYISPESCFCLLLLCSFVMCKNNRIQYDLMVVFVCLYIALPHYDLSEGIELLKCLTGAFCLNCASMI